MSCSQGQTDRVNRGERHQDLEETRFWNELMGTPEPELRPVAESDRTFLESVYFETQRWIIERLFGWRGDDVEAEKFAEIYDEPHSSIIVLNGTDIGWLTVACDEEGFDLEGIYLLPDYHGRGIGTRLIQQLLDRSQKANIPVRLSTAKINPARQLYERLGFQDVREDEFKVYMELLPDKTPRPAH